MPPKTVTCSICNQEVLKAHTLARKDGSRACRSHSEVETEAKDLQLADHNRRIKEFHTFKSKRHQHETPEHRRERELKFETELAPWREYVHTHCWVCERPGISLQEFYFKQLVAMKRLELRGEPFNLLTMWQDVAKLMDGEIPLIRIPYNEQTDRKMQHLVKDKKLRDLLWAIHQLQLCGDCVNKYGFRERFEAMMPEPTWEQLRDVRAVAQVILDPVLKELAEKKEGQS